LRVLGNPGAQYAGSRHNAGEDFLRELARQSGATLRAESRFAGESGEVLFAGHRLCALLVPTTFMNRSGQVRRCAGGLLQDRGRTDILIAHDELDLPPGTARASSSRRRSRWPQWPARHHSGARRQSPGFPWPLRVSVSGIRGMPAKVSGYVLARAIAQRTATAYRRQRIDAGACAPCRLLLDGDASRKR
jgi:PTH1 family peptidyl-tRNA hydrolase